MIKYWSPIRARDVRTAGDGGALQLAAETDASDEAVEAQVKARLERAAILDRADARGVVALTDELGLGSPSSHQAREAAAERVDGHGREQDAEGGSEPGRVHPGGDAVPGEGPGERGREEHGSSGQSRCTWPPKRAASDAALLMAMTSSEVPTAAGISKPRASTSAGTMTNPPPTPKKPVSSPTAVAAATILTARRGPPPASGRAPARRPRPAASRAPAGTAGPVPRAVGTGSAGRQGELAAVSQRRRSGAGRGGRARLRAAACAAWPPAATSMSTANRVSSRSGATPADSRVPA